MTVLINDAENSRQFVCFAGRLLYFNESLHCRAQELRCSTKVILMSPASRVNLTARSSSNVQPLPPHPVVMASLQTAATFSRNNLFLIFLMLGKSCAILVTP